jgi:hypothetical protein
MLRARSLIAVAALALLLATPAGVEAQVALRYPGSPLRCAAGIALGVRYDASTGASPRGASVTVTAGTKTIFRRSITALTTWTYWHLHPPCGHTYVVRYTSASALIDYRVKVLRR